MKTISGYLQLHETIEQDLRGLTKIYDGKLNQSSNPTSPNTVASLNFIAKRQHRRGNNIVNLVDDELERFLMDSTQICDRLCKKEADLVHE